MKEEGEKKDVLYIILLHFRQIEILLATFSYRNFDTTVKYVKNSTMGHLSLLCTRPTGTGQIN